MLKNKGFALIVVALLALSAISFMMTVPMSANAAGNVGNGANKGNGMSLGNQEDGRILVKFANGSKKSDVAELNSAEEIDSLSQLGVKVMKVKNPKAIAKLVANNKHIEYAEEDSVMELALAPTDPSYKANLTLSARIINAEAGWDYNTTSSVKVAVLDTGLNAHADLPTPIRTYNAVSKNNNVTDLNGHGTLVAGTLAGLANNGIGGAGIIWDYSNLTFIRISEQANGSANVSDIAAGIIYAVDNGAKIISLSYGGTTNNATQKNAIDYAVSKGCIVFAASGNESTSTTLTNVCYPARLDNVMGVGALSSPTARATYSNGGTGLDIMTSGSWYAPTYTGGYNTWSGTSCATPIAAGIAALVWELLPSYTNIQIMQFMKDYAKDINTAGWDAQTGYGVADMGILLAKAAEIAASNSPVEEVEEEVIADTVAPTLTLNGSTNMTMYLNGTFAEPGYKAVDDVDGDITNKVVVTGSVNTNAVGTYTLTYTVSDEAGNTASATRTVNVIADKASFGYSYKGKAGTSYNETLKAAFAGTAAITVPGLDAKAQITVTIKDAAGNVVFNSAFAAGTTKTINLKAGTYTVTTKIDTANGNITVNVNIALVQTASAAQTNTAPGK